MKQIQKKTIIYFYLDLNLSKKVVAPKISDMIPILPTSNNSNFILCTDRARICFKCYIKVKRKCSFENAPVEKSESSTNLK